MREHEACEEAINAALAAGADGRAEFLATRCDLLHGDTRPDPRADEVRAAMTTPDTGTDPEGEHA